MGKSGSQNLANGRLWISIHIMMFLVSLWPGPARCQECRIQRCNAEYVASTSPSGGQPQEEEPAADAAARAGYCAALRAYSRCTRRTARGCRGDLVYHSAVFRVKELFSQHNCSSEGPTPPPSRAGGTPTAPPYPAGGTPPSAPAPPQRCDYERRALAAGGPPVSYAHCALFGDPHLRTFRDEVQTCRAEGAWPLVDNRYLSVQVTNVPVAPGASATAASKITVIFKAFGGCTEPKVYQATSEDLPSVFLDGTRSGGEGGSLWIAERDGEGAAAAEQGGARRVRIEARYVGTSVVVRRVGRYLSIAVRTPEEVLGSPPEEGGGLQLCLHGCPLGQLIGDHALAPPLPRPHPGPAHEWAAARCREALQVEDVYFHSCVFDLLTTGDPQFSLAAFGALEDLKALPPSRLELGSSGTSQLYRGAAPHGPGVTPTSLLTLLALLLLLVLN
ncbi:repulsive guidance molecule A-like [Anguilla rostrata]|uniref:repulsive guidance molecule A-like n=1 Tax=Anguilla rostrata TaxID=7938 RepID=UPI0030CD2705